MSVINELIREESNGTISFGDYTLEAKAKLDGFAHKGGSYKVKTCREITKLECDDLFVYESVPGTAVHAFIKDEDGASFTVEGAEDAQITLELLPETEYEVMVGSKSTGVVKTNLGGKLSVSVELAGAGAVYVEVRK